jgi:hypothetical protein
LIGIAFLFHSTALLFSVFFFLNKDFKQIWIVVILFLLLFIGKQIYLLCFFSFAGNAVGGASAFKVDFLYRRAKSFWRRIH